MQMISDALRYADVKRMAGEVPVRDYIRALKSSGQLVEKRAFKEPHKSRKRERLFFLTATSLDLFR